MSGFSESLRFSFQNIDEIPTEIKALYKTAWEIKQSKLISMAADRGAFIDQSQSFNVFIAEPHLGTLTAVHFLGWKKVRTKLYAYILYRSNDMPCIIQSILTCEFENGKKITIFCQSNPGKGILC